MGGFEMMRVIVSIVVLLAVNSAAAAQLKKAPPEKLSPRPVQPAPRVKPAPKASPGAMTYRHSSIRPGPSSAAGTATTLRLNRCA
jgi:hypothetical protein